MVRTNRGQNTSEHPISTVDHPSTKLSIHEVQLQPRFREFVTTALAKRATRDSKLVSPTKHANAMIAIIGNWEGRKMEVRMENWKFAIPNLRTTVSRLKNTFSTLDVSEAAHWWPASNPLRTQMSLT
jgi:hypothetical protein